jgi:hypothetical protein
MIAIPLFIVIIFLMILFWTIKNGITPMPTAPKVKKTLLNELPKKLNGTIIDLGSGWGTLCFSLAKKYPHCTVVGFENSHIPYYYSVIKKALSGQPNLTFERRDFFNAPINHASLIVCYLYPKAMEKLKDKFALELKPNTVVVSHTFAIPGLHPNKTVTASDIYRSKIYFYSTFHS